MAAVGPRPTFEAMRAARHERFVSDDVHRLMRRHAGDTGFADGLVIGAALCGALVPVLG